MEFSRFCMHFMLAYSGNAVLSVWRPWTQMAYWKCLPCRPWVHDIKTLPLMPLTYTTRLHHICWYKPDFKSMINQSWRVPGTVVHGAVGDTLVLLTLIASLIGWVLHSNICLFTHEPDELSQWVLSIEIMLELGTYTDLSCHFISSKLPCTYGLLGIMVILVKTWHHEIRHQSFIVT